MAAVAHFGAGDSTTFVSASGAAGTIGKPANVAVGDLLVVLLYNQFSGGTIQSGLTGWTAAATAIGPRSGGVYYLPITDPSTLAALPASWTPTFGAGQGGRLCFLMFRVTGADLTNPIDAVGAVATQNATSPTVVSGITTATAGLLLALNYWNNSAAITSTVGPDPSMTDGQQISTPTTTNTSGIEVAFQQLSADGTTGARSFTTSPAGAANSGMLFAIRAASGVGAVTLSGSGALAVSGAPVMPGTVTLSGAGALSVHPRRPVDDWLADLPIYVAHRGGSGDWDESTMFAYDQAVAWSATLALEAPVWKSLDNVWIINHDNDPSVTGTWSNPGTGNITARNWAGDLEHLVSAVHGSPMIRLVDLLAKYGNTRILWIENKGSIDVAGWLDLLDSYAGAARYVIKQYYDNSAVPIAAHARGYLTWGYYYDADAVNLPSTQSNWDILGMQYNASAGSWTAAKSYGKPVAAHIPATAAQAALAEANGATGYMVAGVREIVPQTPAAVVLAGSGALVVVGLQRASGSVVLSGMGELVVGADLVLSGTALSAGVGVLAVSGEPVVAGVVVLAGTSALVLLASERDITVLVAGPFRHPLTASTPTRNPLTVSGATT